MKYFILFLCCCLLQISLQAQQLTNARFQTQGEQIVVTYDLLNAQQGQTFEVSLLYSTDGGKTWQAPRNLSGDIGKTQSGSSKRIVWQVLKDLPNGLHTNIGFKIKATFSPTMATPKATPPSDNSSPSDNSPPSGGQGGASKPSIKMISIPGKDFKMSETEVTIGQYLAFCNATNSHWPEWLEQGNKYNIYTGTNDRYKEKGMSESNTNYPITGVSATDADAFCRWMGGSLPTEQEWEYAAKGGQSYRYAGSDNIDEVAWSRGNSSKKSHPVKQKQANGYGLYDMSGNVWEWTSSYRTEDSARVLRGGSWLNYATDCRVAIRYGSPPGFRSSYYGFRFAVR